MRRFFTRLLSALVVAAVSSAGAADRAYPTKPIRLLVPYAPGGGNDTMARAIGRKLTETWGQWAKVVKESGARAD